MKFRRTKTSIWPMNWSPERKKGKETLSSGPTSSTALILKENDKEHKWSFDLSKSLISQTKSILKQNKITSTALIARRQCVILQKRDISRTLLYFRSLKNKVVGDRMGYNCFIDIKATTSRQGMNESLFSRKWQMVFNILSTKLQRKINI